MNPGNRSPTVEVELMGDVIGPVVFFGLIGSFVCGMIGQKIAEPRGQGGLGFLLGVLLGPIGLIVAALLPYDPNTSYDQPSQPMRPKPSRTRYDPNERRRITDTSAWLESAEPSNDDGDNSANTSNPPLAIVPQPARVVLCPHCGNRVLDDGTRCGWVVGCPSCRQTFTMPLR
jgi:uncharacterized membrane protein YeaQ/YmgE (transglycosylase-associated protein family)